MKNQDICLTELANVGVARNSFIYLAHIIYIAFERGFCISGSSLEVSCSMLWKFLLHYPFYRREIRHIVVEEEKDRYHKGTLATYIYCTKMQPVFVVKIALAPATQG